MFNIQCSMSKLTFHNIRIAWRNLMKYKTQNIIAVLCLGVGMVFFSIAFIYTQRMLESQRRYGADPRRVEIIFNTKNDSIAFLSISDMKRIGDSHLPSIDFIDINEDRFKFDGTLTDRAGIKHLVKINGKLISPEHLSYLGLRSAITGKPIPVLKPGDIIMTKGMLERTFGKDVNPIGFTVSNGFFVGRYVTNNVIKDVVDTGDWMLTEDCLMLVATPFLQEFKGDDFIETSMLSSFNVILAKGKTADDLKKDLQKTLPEYNIKVLADGYASRQTRLLVIFTFILCSSILLIGLFGFLKTQIQLFRLRQREMGLRQCMGAQREQLFGLMMWEVAIVFFFVTLLTLGLTALLAEYAIPVIEMAFDRPYSFNMPQTYTTELWLCLAVFLVTVAIAALSVCGVIAKPLSQVVGKSHKTSTCGRGLLIVSQMVICQFLFFIIFAGMYFTETYDPDYRLNAEKIQNGIITDYNEWKPAFLDSIPQLQYVSESAHTAAGFLQEVLTDGKEPSVPVYERERGKDRDGNPICVYQVLLTDDRLFGMLDIKVSPTATDLEFWTVGTIPVYAPKERAAELRKKFGVKQQGAPVYHNIEKGKQAERVGFVDGRKLAPFTQYDDTPKYVYVCDTSYFSNKESLSHRAGIGLEYSQGEYMTLKHSIIFMARPNQYKAAVKELTNLYQKEGQFTLAKAPIENLYEVCYKESRMGGMMGYISNVMMIVALLCMVLTLYSSVSLDTRGRQKEVAIRKAHGASVGQIIWLFGSPYIWWLVVSSIILLPFCLGLEFVMFEKQYINFENTMELLIPSLFSILFIALVTLLTVGYKIYRVSKLDPAKIIKKE